MTNKQLIKKLDEWGVDYEVLKHKTVFTAHDVAATLKTKLDEIVKTLVIEADKRFYLVSLPASKNIDFKQLKKVIKKMGGSVKSIGIPSEEVLVKKLGIKPGGVTAFSKLHKLPHIIDRDLKKIKKGVLSGGSVSESLKMKIADWIKVEEPKVEIIGVKRKIKPVKNNKKGKSKVVKKKLKIKKSKPKARKVVPKRTNKRRR
ncbi:MAG: YbaK/EbsC family protein [Candidatus Komeilibacteria bacterium]